MNTKNKNRKTESLKKGVVKSKPKYKSIRKTNIKNKKHDYNKKMNNKKNIAILVFILVVSVVTIVFLFKTKKADISVDNAGQTIAPAEVKPEIEKEEVREFSTVFAEGEIVSFENNELEMKNGEIVNKLALVEDALVYVKNGEEIEKKEISDLKEEISVKVEIDMENSRIISVEIK